MNENDVITHMEYLTLTDDEILEQANQKKALIIKEFDKIAQDDATVDRYSLIKEEFKYIRLNIENKFQVEGKVKIEYGITEDNDLGIVSLPNIVNMTMFKSLYSNSDSFLINDVVQEIFNKYKGKLSVVYIDSKENYLKEFFNNYVKSIQSIFELLMYCVDDTIEFKKIGNVVEISTLNTVDNSLKYKARELNSFELFKQGEDFRPKKYMSLQEIIDTKPLKLDYSFLVKLMNDDLFKQLNETFDSQYQDDASIQSKREQIINELYEKMKLM